MQEAILFSGAEGVVELVKAIVPSGVGGKADFEVGEHCPHNCFCEGVGYAHERSWRAIRHGSVEEVVPLQKTAHHTRP